MKVFKRSATLAALALALNPPVMADHHMQPSDGMTYGPGKGMGSGMMQGPMMGYGMGMMHGGPMMGYGMGMGGMDMMPCPMTGGLQGPGGGLQLDEEQQKKMNRIREQLWKQQQEHMQKMWEHHNEMQKLWQEGMPDSDKVLDAHRNMQKDQLEMLEERLKLQKEMDEVLTDEQRKQLWQMQRRMYRGNQ